MSDFGFKINVNSDHVKLAHERISAMMDGIDEVRESDISLDVSGIEGAAEMLAELKKELASLKSLAHSGSSKGFLDSKQFKEVAHLSKAIREDFESYSNFLGQAESKLDGMLSRRSKLDKELNSGTYMVHSERQAKEKESAELSRGIEKLIKALDKNSRKEEKLRSQQRSAADDLAGMGEDPAKNQNRNLLSKMGKGALALFGVHTAMKYVNESLVKTDDFEEAEAKALMRDTGGTLDRKGKYGYDALKMAAFREELNENTGLTGGEKGSGLDQATDVGAKFSKAFGQDGTEIIRYMGGLFQSTKMDGERYEKHLGQIGASIKKNEVGGLTGEYLKQNTRLLTMLSESRGGAPLDKSETTLANLVQSKMWGMGVVGQGESGSAMLSAANKSIVKGGDSPLSQMFHFRALGGATNMKELNDLKLLREKGITGMREVDGKQVTNAESYIGYAKKVFGTGSDGRVSEEGKSFLANDLKLPMATVALVEDLLSSLSGKELTSALKKLMEEGGVKEGEKDPLDQRVRTFEGTKYGRKEEYEKQQSDFLLSSDLTQIRTQAREVVVDIVTTFFDTMREVGKAEAGETVNNWQNNFNRPAGH